MDINNLIIVIIIWIAANAISPLLLNSIERQYQEKIDGVVSGFLGYIKKLLIRLVQLLMIVLFLPNIAIGFIVQNKQFKNRKLHLFFRNYVLLKEAVLEKKFPATLGRGYRAWRTKDID